MASKKPTASNKCTTCSEINNNLFHKEKSQKIDSLLPLFDEFYLDFYPDSKTLEKISSNKKRLILNHSDYKNLKNKKGIFGIILD
jgi:hypothetical protein